MFRAYDRTYHTSFGALEITKIAQSLCGLQRGEEMQIETPRGRWLYLDCAATRPTEPEVLDAMAEEARRFPANPSSIHGAGRFAAERFEELRSRFLELLGLDAGHWRVVFTSGGTEADALALLGRLAVRGGGDVCTTTLEHSAVLGCRPMVERLGGHMVVVPCGRGGRVDPNKMADAVTPQTRVLSVMHTNNEIGTIFDVTEIARAVRRHVSDVTVHSDAVQALGHVGKGFAEMGLDMFSFSAHKIGGPKGCGALVYRRQVRLAPLMGGGGQQEGLRSGTLDLASVAGFVRALELEQIADMKAVSALRDHLWHRILEKIPTAKRNGEPPFAPHVLSVALPGIGSDVVVRALSDRGLAASAGSACSAGTGKRSAVLDALKIPQGWGMVRLSLCRHTTIEQVDEAADVIAEVWSEYGL